MKEYNEIETKEMIDWASYLPVIMRVAYGGVNHHVEMARKLVDFIKQQNEKIELLNSEVKRFKKGIDSHE